MKHFRIQRYFSNCWSFIDGIEYNSYEDAEKAIKEHYSEQNTRIINMEEDDIDIGESPYCPVCESCGEEGCCSVENSLWKHGCKYGEWYARDVYQNEMIIDEFHKLFDENGKYLGCDGNPIEVVYNNAFDRTKEKYGKGN